MEPLVIRQLRMEDEGLFEKAIEEFEEEGSEFQFALGYEKGQDFAAYIRMHDEWSRGINLPDGFVPSSFLVGAVGDRLVGRLSIRHRLNEFLRAVGGHIGYGVVPSERRKGYATSLLRHGVGFCKELGIARVLVTCDEDNVGSAKVTERCNWILGDVTNLPELKKQKRRYWINTGL